MKKSYFEASHYYVVGKHANAVSYQYVTPDGELTNSSLFAMVFDNSQEASDMAERLYHENPTFNFKSISDSGYDVLGNRITVQDDSDTWATKKMKKSKSITKEKDYWEFDNPDDMKFILEVNHNGVPVGERTVMAGATFQMFEYEGKKYELLIMDDGRLGDMVLYEEKDYSHLTFDLFKKTIQDYIDDYDNQMRGLHTEMGFDDEYEPLGDYTFHDNGEGHYTFSYDSMLYELMNYGTGDFKWGLHDALENAGFEWGVNIEQDTYSDIGFYDPNVNKSTKKMKKSDEDAIERFIKDNEEFFKDIATRFDISTIDDYVYSEIEESKPEGITVEDSRKIARMICDRWNTAGWQYDKMATTKKMKKSIQDDKDLQYEIRHFGTNLGTTWHGVSGASDYSQFFKDDDRVYRFDHDASGRQMDVRDVTDEDFVIQCPTEAYINIKNTSTKKMKKSQVDWYQGMPLEEFMRANRDAGSLGVGGTYDRYSVICDGQQVGSSYKSVPEEYAQCGVIGVELIEMVEFDMLEITIECPADKSAKKSYTPDYHDFRTMLTNMKVTKNNRTVFKR